MSRSTIRRRREAGDFPNAHQDAKGAWLVPLTDLLAAGLHPGSPTPPTVEVEQAQTDAEVRDLRALLETERAQRRAAEQIAEERGRALDDLRSALRMIEARKPEAHELTQQQEPPKRRRWFGR